MVAREMPENFGFLRCLDCWKRPWFCHVHKIIMLLFKAMNISLTCIGVYVTCFEILGLSFEIT